MAAHRGWLTGLLAAGLGLATAVKLAPDPDVPPPSFPCGARIPSTPAPQPAAPMAMRADAVERTPAAHFAGMVVDETGAPVRGVLVTWTGCDAVVCSENDGSFEFPATVQGRCRALPQIGWLAVESALLALGQPERRPRLVVVRAMPVTGRVVDEHETPIAGAAVSVELRVDPGAGSPARSVQLAEAWSTTSDTDGWYSLPLAPTGPQTTLIVTRDGFATTRVALSAAPSYQQVRLERAGDAIAVETPDPVPEHTFGGWLDDERCLPRAGWWAGAVAVDTKAGPGGSLGRFAAPPVRLHPDGRFVFVGLPAGRYRIEAWTPDNLAVARTAAIDVPSPEVRMVASEPPLPERVRGRVVDGEGRPVPGVIVGVGRPTGWAVPGRLGMHASSAVPIDRDGHFELTLRGLATLEVRVDGAAVVPLGVALTDDTEPISIRVDARRWLGDRDGAVRDLPVVPGTMLLALDGEGRPLPIWAGDAPAARSGFDPTAGGPFGFPADARTLVWRAGRRDLARLVLR